MSRLPSPLPDTSGSLFLHISSVPKINKTQFISSYVKEQTIHAKTYAAEGRAFERSWKQEVQAPMSNLEATPGPQKTSKTSKLAMDYGFETPVLKPRDAKRLDGSKKIPPTKDRKVSSVENLTHGDEVSKHKRKRKQRRSSVPRKGSSLSGSEKEYDQRLKERRERKRVKRAVMKSASNDNSLDESFAEGAKGKNRIIKKTAKNMGLAGLALMHGFTATNVGKGRLTVKPSLNVGVFNKGKASLKSRPTHRDKRPCKKGGHMNDGFIKSDLPSKMPRNLRKRSAASGTNSETSSNPSSCRKAKKTERLRKLKRFTSNSVRLETSPATTENVGGPIKLDNRKPTESLTWDIERESVILPSQLSTSVSEEPSSVLLDTKNTSWSKAPVGLALCDVPSLGNQGPLALHLTTPSDDTEPRHASRSIGPSESASQHVNLSPTRRDLPAMEAASKYFASVPQSQPSEKQPSSAGVTSTRETKQVVVTEPLTCGFSNTNEKHNFSLALSSDAIAAQAEDEKEQATNRIYDSFLRDLDDLPLVEPQDYKYSDYSLQAGPLEDLDCYDEILQTVITSHSALDDLDDERANNFFSHHWDAFEHAYPQELEQTGYEEQYYNQEESLDDGGYDASECEAIYNLPSQEASEIGDRGLIHNAEWTLEDLGYHTGKPWQGMGEVHNADNSPILISLDTCINSDLESGESVDLIGTFAEGKALLRGYSEAEAHAFYSSIPCRQIRVSGAEADVAKRLKNHWLPQRL